MPVLTDLVHILDKKTDEIIGTLSLKNAEYSNAIRNDSIQNENTFDFIVNAKLEKASLLEKRNRLLIQDEDGFYKEYVIYYAEQYTRYGKTVKSNASFTDLAKAKVVSPQTLTGATSLIAAQLALDGTEWQTGIIEYSGTKTIEIKDYTNPLSMLKQIASEFELELGYRVEIDGNKIIGRYIDLKQQLAGFEGKEIVFGKDLIGVKRKEDSGSIVTALLVIGPQKDDGTRITLLVEDKAALQRWGRNSQHLIEAYEPQSTDSNIDANGLKSLGETELAKRIDAIVTYECEAASLEHIFGREHEKIRLGQTVRIKDDGYNPPLYVEGRIQDVEVNQISHQVNNFSIGNFREYRKSDLEDQVKWLKGLLAQKASASFVQNYAEKKKVYSADPPADTAVIWIKPDITKNVNIAHTYEGSDWVPITTTSASDIVEGTMLFDRLQGGALVLGGKDNGNGLLLVLDDEGNQIGSFDASTGGFSNLYVADFDSPTVASYSSSDLVFFVAGAADSARGIADPDDNNAGNGWGAPLQTISEALRRIPKVYDGNATIYLAYGQTFYETGISISGYSGSGTITIDGQYKTGTRLNGSILVSNHPLLVTIKNFTIQSNNPDFVIKADNQARVNADNMLIFGISGNGTVYGMVANGGSYAEFKNSDIYSCQRPIGGSYGGWAYVSNCIGNGSVAGLTAWAGWIVGNGNAPGGASNTSIAYGGSITGTFTYNSGAGSTPTTAPTIGTWTSAGSDSYSDGAGVWDNTTNDPLQGKYGSAGNYRGCWFFGTGLSSAVTGKTIKQIRVYLTRADRSGSSGAVNAVIRPHSYASQPGGQPAYLGASYTVPFKLSEGKWVTLPSTFISLFQSGSAKGIMVYTTNTADYMRFLQTAKIEITYA